MRTLRFILWIALAGLLFMVLRGVRLGGPFPWADLANAVCCAALLVLLRIRPDWLRSVAWVGLMSFLLNGLDGLLAGSVPRAVAPYQVLLPLLVLYGALLGDRWLSVTALAAVLAFYTYAAAAAWPLSRPDLLMLTNLAIATVIMELASLGVWLQHRRLVDDLHERTRDLLRELDARARLHAILFHDISNTLTALVNASAIVLKRAPGQNEDQTRIHRIAMRMLSLLRAARSMESDQDILRSTVAVGDLHAQVLEVFGDRLAAKEQQLVQTGGDDLAVIANVPLLCHSILGNIVSNAIKYSPRGAIIEFAAQAEGDRVRIEVCDRGAGFLPDVLEQGARGGKTASRRGTEGEEGSGQGMRIAALCLARMEGTMEVRNRASGGGAVAVLLPLASPGADRAPRA